MTEAPRHWPCASCGADLTFAPGQDSLKCPFCGHEQAIPKASSQARATALTEHDLARGLADDLPRGAMEDIRTTRCGNCGAQVEFQGETFSQTCPFCASPVVAEKGSHAQIKPQALIPFALTESEARKRMTDWLGRLWFAPNGLVEYARKGRALNGIYVPFWTFDADTASRYRGARGIYYYETRNVTVTVNGKRETRQEQVRHTRWTPVSGGVARRFDDVLELASTSLPPRLGAELTPWDLSALVPYSQDYLAGFRAEGYSIGLAEGNKAAKSRMAQVIRTDVARDIGGDEQRIDQVETRWSDETFKHILLPVWTAAYRYGGKSFVFLVNGQTGEVQGERPWSVWKIAFAVLLALILAGTALYVADRNGAFDDTGYSTGY